MALTNTKWRFKCAGTYAGVVSWSNDDEDATHYMLKVDYYGGKFSVEISERDFNKIQSEKKVGCDVRVSGLLLINGGNPRACLDSLKFEGDKGFEPIDLQEMIDGMRCEGFGTVSRKYQYQNDAGQVFCSCSLSCNGGNLHGVRVDSECFSKLTEGPCIVIGQVVTDINKVFIDRRPTTQVKSELIVKGSRNL